MPLEDRLPDIGVTSDGELETSLSALSSSARAPGALGAEAR